MKNFLKNLKNVLKSVLCDPHSNNKISSLRLLLWLTILFYFFFLCKIILFGSGIKIPESLDTLVLYLVSGIVLGKFQKKNDIEQSKIPEKKDNRKFIVEDSGHDSDWSEK